jgi:hypothetical protein
MNNCNTEDRCFFSVAIGSPIGAGSDGVAPERRRDFHPATRPIAPTSAITGTVDGSGTTAVVATTIVPVVG